jgi:hypothetical protein
MWVHELNEHLSSASPRRGHAVTSLNAASLKSERPPYRKGQHAPRKKGSVPRKKGYVSRQCRPSTTQTHTSNRKPAYPSSTTKVLNVIIASLPDMQTYAGISVDWLTYAANLTRSTSVDWLIEMARRILGNCTLHVLVAQRPILVGQAKGQCIEGSTSGRVVKHNDLRVLSTEPAIHGAYMDKPASS